MIASIPILNKSILHTDGTLSSGASLGQNVAGSNDMKVYSEHHKYPELDPHHQMQFTQDTFVLEYSKFIPHHYHRR